MATKQAQRATWKYRKKPKKYRKPIIMEVKEDLPMTRAITSTGLEIFPLPKGRYEIEYQPHPDPDRPGEQYYWIVVEHDGVKVGAAKAFFESLERQGVVRIFMLDNTISA